MICPKCNVIGTLYRKGYYIRPSDNKKIPRLMCRHCGKRTSIQWWSPEYRLKKREIKDEVYNLICRGMSQRATAEHLQVRRPAIACRVKLFGRCSEANLEYYRSQRAPATVICLDEMETFEHTKCKPLTVPIYIEDKSRKILGIALGKIPPRNPKLAQKSRTLYGKRTCERKIILDSLTSSIKNCATNNCTIKTDKSPHYEKPIKKHIPNANHKKYAGRKPSETGLGELKKGAFDPLFSLNHTLAMFRDNLKTLSRKTWCTAKKQSRLLCLLNMYAWFHNKRLDRPRKRVSLAWESRTNQWDHFKANT